MRRMITMAVGLLLLAFGSQAAAQVTLPYFEDFEMATATTYTNNLMPVAITGLKGWTIESETADGRLRMAAGGAFCKSGSRAATLDRNPNGTDQSNFLVVTLNMTNYAVANDTVLLDFSYMHHGEEPDVDDRVWVRGSNTDNWVEVYNLNTNQGGTGAYRDVVDLDVRAALSGATQDFSATFQIRFGQQDNYYASSINSLDGRTFDDVGLRLLVADDVGVSGIVDPEEKACGLSTNEVTVEVTNYGSKAQSMIPVTVAVSGAVTANLTGTLAGPLAPGATDTLILGPFNGFAGGAINFDAKTALAMDAVPSNDGFKATVTLSPTEVAITPPAKACLGEAGSIAVANPGMGSFDWYDMAMGGMPVGMGATFMTPAVNMSTTYYAERGASTENVGPKNTLIGGGGTFNGLSVALEFDVLQESTIVSVKAQAGSEGDVVVRVRDSSNMVVGTAMATVAANDVGTLVTIPVNLKVPVGTGYTMDAVGSTVTNLFRNNGGAVYPYSSSSINITGPSNNLNTYYYFFYDWEVKVGSCSGERTPVTIEPDEAACSTDMQITKTASAEAVAGSEIVYTITVTNNGASNAHSIEVTDTPPMGLTFVKNEGDCTTAFPCAVGTLAPAATATITSTFAIAADFTGTIENTAAVTTTATETMAGDESAKATTNVTASSDLSVTITDAPDPANVGDDVTYTVEVSNAGPSDAAKVVVDLTASMGLTAKSTNGCEEDPNGTPSCGLGTIKAGEKSSFTVVATADAAGTYTMDASAKSDATDVDMMNNSASAETTINDGNTSGAGGSSSTGAGSGGGDAGSGGGDGSGGPAPSVDSGCGCSTPGQSQQPLRWLWVLAAAGLVGARRRRRS